MYNTKVDFFDIGGKIKPLHGVNSGPKTYSFYYDTTEYFLEAGIPFSRLHDTEFPYGSGHFVDVPCIFKNFDADENNPDNYDFELTDLYIQSILDAGTKVFYRLGVSIEHAPIKRNIFPPRDFHKWARICEHIIRHFNEGWADGHFFGIEYFEIWNEPEGHGCNWPDTDENFYRLYSITANHLKSCFGDKIKVGGYASCGLYGGAEENPSPDHQYKIDFANAFFKYITAPETKAPLDFYTWHAYIKDINLLAGCGRFARKLLDSYGFTKAESILDEWNYADYPNKEMHNAMPSSVGASYCASALITMQQNSVDVGCYYDAQPAMHYCGIFSLETIKPTKAFYSFKAFNELYKLKNECFSSSDNDSIKICSAVDENLDKAGILISCYDCNDDKISIEINGFSGKNGVKLKIYATTDDETFREIEDRTIYSDKFTLYRNVKNHSVYYISLEKGEA